MDCGAEVMFIKIREERDSTADGGAVLIFAALSMVVLLAIVAVAINAGRIAAVRTQAQAAVDAAAMAGVAGIPPHSAGVDSNKETIARLINALNVDQSGLPTSNIVDGKSASIQSYTGTGVAANPDFIVRYFDATTHNFYNVGNYSAGLRKNVELRDLNALTVTKSYPVDNFLAAFIAPNQSRVNVTATAVFGGATCMKPQLPIAISDCQSDGGFQYTSDCKTNCSCDTATNLCAGDITLDLTTSNANSDNMAWFAPPGYGSANDSDIERWIREGMPTTCVGNSVLLINGVTSNMSCVQDVKNHYFNNPRGPNTCQGGGQGNGQGNQNQHVINRPDLQAMRDQGITNWDALVPIVDCSARNYNQSWQVKGFTYVRIIGTDGNTRITVKRVCNSTIPFATGGGAINCDNTTGNPSLLQ